MADRVHFHQRLIFSPGTQVVILRDITADAGRVLHPKGAVGVVVRSPSDPSCSYTNKSIGIPYLFDENGKAKPAFYAVQKVFLRN